MVLLSEGDNGRTVDIHQGESIQIRLSENATSGYRWAIDHYDDEFIQALAAEPRYGADAIGSGGEVAFLFQVKKIGRSEIVLKHWRQWEGDSSVTTSFRIRINSLE